MRTRPEEGLGFQSVYPHEELREHFISAFSEHAFIGQFRGKALWRLKDSSLKSPLRRDCIKTTSPTLRRHSAPGRVRGN